MSSYNNNIEAAIATSLKEAKEAANLNAKESKALQNGIKASEMNALQKEKELKIAREAEAANLNAAIKASEQLERFKIYTKERGRKRKQGVMWH